MSNQEFAPPDAATRANDELPAPGAGAPVEPVPPVEPPRPTPPIRPVAHRQPSAFGRGFGLGSGFAIGAGLAAAAMTLVFALFLTLAGFAALVGGTATATTAVAPIWGSGSTAVRAVSLSGSIMSDASDGGLLAAGTYGNELAKQIDDLDAADAEALVLLVNTPGGSIGGSRAVSDAVERYQERTGKKAFVHVTSMSASGGVYATATADEIIADHGALIGSIGVLFGPFSYYDGVVALSGSLLESGVTTTGGITSEYLYEGRSKDFGNPFRPVTDEERAHYQAGLANEYDNFVNHVSTHRGIPAATIKDEMGALIFDAQRAEELGLIDGTMGRDDFYRHVAEQIGVGADDLRVEAVRAPSAWESLLGVERASGVAPAVEQGAGIVPAVSSAFCQASQPLVFAGDLKSVCG